jgi:hypothetical protein
MSEEFKEENTTGEIIKFDKDDDGNGEQEGINWGSIGNIFRPAARTVKNSIFNIGAIIEEQQKKMRQQIENARRDREAQERALREKAQREQDEIMRVRNMEVQIKQLSARVSQLESIIRNKDRLIDRKNKHITFLTSENTRLRKKVNSLLDNLQYYKTSVLGTDQVDGYKTTVVKQQLKIDELLQQEIGKPITASKDGFENIYEGFHYDYDSLNKEHVILEGYADQLMSSYNAVFTENQAMQNHNDNTTNIYSINNQLTSNIIARQNTLKYVNFILIIVFFIVYLYGCYKVYTINGMENYIKIAICIAMLFTIFILHIIEYIIFTILPVFIGLIVKIPIKPFKYFKGPSIYDYLPSLSLPPSKK